MFYFSRGESVQRKKGSGWLPVLMNLVARDTTFEVRWKESLVFFSFLGGKKRGGREKGCDPCHEGGKDAPNYSTRVGKEGRGADLADVTLGRKGERGRNHSQKKEM